MLVIPAPGRLRQKNCEFKAGLSYIVRRYLKKKKKKEKTENKYLHLAHSRCLIKIRRMN
jgi:hypothetical protein